MLRSGLLSRRSFAVLLLGSLPTAAVMAQTSTDPLPSWRDGVTKRAILEFLRKTTEAGSTDFVPEPERLAVFDNDGTLWAEQPIYPEVAFAVERIKALAPQHPEWHGVEALQTALSGDMAALAKGGLRAMGAVVLASHGDLTPEALDQLVSKWLLTARHPRFDRPYTACGYQPMMEVLALFRAHGYHTCIVTGGTSVFVRAWAEGMYGVSPDQVIGSTLKQTYLIQDGHGEVVQAGEIADVDEGPSKAVNISKTLGRRPHAAFGNSDGDYQMLQFTTTGPRPSLGVLIHHDDGDREYAYDRDTTIGKLDHALTDAAQNGWLVTSMKTDWSRVFTDRA